jgi:hemerythrin
MPVMWRNQMSVGNDRIDQDHRYLLCLINTIDFTLGTGEHQDILVTALDQLDYYTKDHFVREEKLMLKIGYSRYPDQKTAHELLISQLEEIREKILRVQDDPEMLDIIPDLTELLRNWLLDHVLKDDMLMKPILQKYPSGYT